MNTDASESTSTSKPVTRRLVAAVIAEVVDYSALIAAPTRQAGDLRRIPGCEEI